MALPRTPRRAPRRRLFRAAFASVAALGSAPAAHAAGWGDNWGQLVWGSSELAVPALSGPLLAALGVVLVGVGAWVVRRRAGS